MSKNGKALAKRQGISGSIEINSLDEVARVANMMAQSGFFGDAKNAQQAGVKIIAGMELGIPPMASMRGIHVFDGNTTLSGPLLASLIKKHPRYDYRIRKADREGAEIAFFENGEEVGTASFDKEDAKAAGLLGKQNWRKYPTDMYVWRTLARGQRWYCPDVGDGALYTPDEMGSETDKQGNPIDVGEAKVVREESAPSGDSAPSEPSEPAPASDEPETATWRGDTVSAKQAEMLETIEQRFRDCDTPKCTFEKIQKARQYASEQPKSYAQRIHTIISEAREALHDGQITDEGIDRVALWKVLSDAKEMGGIAMMNEQLEIIGDLADDYDEATQDALSWLTMPYHGIREIWKADTPTAFDEVLAIADERPDQAVERGAYTKDVADIARQKMYREAHAAAKEKGIELEGGTDTSEADDDLFGKPELTHKDEG